MKKQLTAIAAATGLALTAFAGSADAKGKPGDANIVEIASAVNADTGEFTTLLTAATCPAFDGAIVAALTSDDKVTLFAPTDAAFAGLGLTADNVCSALEPAALANVLTYHVTDGRRFSNSLFNKKNSKDVAMLNGGEIMTNADLTISTSSDQTVGFPSLDLIDINASNGVIHAIDTVMLPAG